MTAAVTGLTSSAAHLALFSLVVGTLTAVAVTSGAVVYLRRHVLERPPLGTFHGRDIAVLFVPLSTIPVFYLALPRLVLTGFLVLTFSAALSIGLRPLLRPTALWSVVGVLLGANVWLGTRMLGTVVGWQLFWAENDVIVLLAAVSVANLYVQGGMRLRHVAWFALVLAVYDVVFSTAFPVTNALVEDFLGHPLDPSVGMRWGFDNAAVGLGDLVVYALFVAAAFKAYGRRAAHVSTAVVVGFGAVVPALVPLILDYVDARTDTLVPAQFWFGPAAFVTYRLLRRRYGAERTVAQFLASDDAVRRRERALPRHARHGSFAPRPTGAAVEPVVP